MTCKNQPKYTCAKSSGWDRPKCSPAAANWSWFSAQNGSSLHPKNQTNLGQSRLTFGSRAPGRSLVHLDAQLQTTRLGWLPGEGFTSALLLLLPRLMAPPSAWYTEVFVGQVGFVLTTALKSPCWDRLAVFPVCSVHLSHFLSRLTVCRC